MDRESSLLGATWRLHSFDSGTGSLHPPLSGTELTATFEGDGRLTGSAGCNRYMTTYESTGSTMTVNPQIAATQMWCGEPEGSMAQESAFLRTWGRVAAYRLRADRLELVDAEGASVFVFEPTETSESAR